MASRRAWSRVIPISVLAIVVVGLALAIYSRPTHTPPVESSSPRAQATLNEVAPPIWAANLLLQLDCVGPPQQVGGERGVVGRLGHEGTASPYVWLLALDDVDLPLTGWEENPKTRWEFGESHFVRYVNVVGVGVKAVLLMEGTSVQGGRGDWDMTAFRACDPAEYDELRGRTTNDAPWTNAAGAPSPVNTIIGPGHCGWESTVWLRLGNQVTDPLYLRDPLGLFRDIEVGAYAKDAALPPNARPTGDRSVRWELFITDDPGAVWIRTDSGVERWPRSREAGLGCA